MGLVKRRCDVQGVALQIDVWALDKKSVDVPAPWLAVTPTLVPVKKSAQSDGVDPFLGGERLVCQMGN